MKKPVYLKRDDYDEELAHCPVCYENGDKVMLETVWETHTIYPQSKSEPVGLKCPKCGWETE